MHVRRIEGNSARDDHTTLMKHFLQLTHRGVEQLGSDSHIPLDGRLRHRDSRVESIAMKAALRLRFIRPVDGANYYTGDLRTSKLDCSFTFGLPSPVAPVAPVAPVPPVLSALAEEMAQDRAGTSLQP